MKQSLQEIERIVKDRILITQEIHKPNAWYGHATALKRYAGFNDNYAIKGCIEHGPTFSNEVETFEIDAPLDAVFLTGAYRVPPVRMRTDKAIYLTGSNLTYAQYLLSDSELEEERNRVGKNLLVIPVHSTHHIDAVFDINAYCDDLEKLAREFNTVQVCLYWRDILGGWHHHFTERGFEVVTAGHMFDVNFLSRLKTILDAATLVTVNHVGTQVGYAVQLGKPVYYLSNQDIRTDVSSQGDPSCYVQYGHDAEFDSILSLKKHIQELRSDVSPELSELVHELWGLSFNRSHSELRNLIQEAEDIYEYGVTNSFYMQSSDSIPLPIPSNSPSSELEHLVGNTLKTLAAGHIETALQLISTALTEEYPCRDLYYVYALCCLKMGTPEYISRSFDALRTELQFFPENHSAKELLDTLEISSEEPQFDEKWRNNFEDIYVKVFSHSSLPKFQLQTLFTLARQVCESNLSGNIVECGVGAGGSAAVIASAIHRYDSKGEQKLFLIDSFNGMSAPLEHDYFFGKPASELYWREGSRECDISLSTNLIGQLQLTSHVSSVHGCFEDVLAENSNTFGPIAMLHIDCVFYEACTFLLQTLYGLVSPGAPIVVQGYKRWKGVTLAVDSLLESCEQTPEFQVIENSSIVMIKV